MSLFLSPLLRQRFFDSNGLPLAGGQLFSYAAGTTTPQDTYVNSTGTVNTNPVVLDSQGYCDVWIDPTLSYKFILQDSLGNTQWTVDNVSSPFEITAWSATVSYSQGEIVADSSGFGLFYVSLTNNNVNNALTSVSNWRRLGGNIRTVSTSQTSPTLLATDELVRSNSTAENLIHTLPPCSTTSIGTKITVKDVGTGGNYTQIKGSGTDNVDGSNTWGTKLTEDMDATFENNGSSWDVLSCLADGSVTTQKIAALAVTTATLAAASVVTSKIATGNVTQALMAARATGSTVVAGGVALSGGIGIVTISNDVGSGYAAVPGLSVTITTTGRPVMLLLVPDSSGTSGGGISLGSGSTASLYLGFARGGTGISSTMAWSLGGASGDFPSYAGNISYIDPVAAGTYTYTVIAARSTSNATIGYVQLVAFEL